MDKANFITRQDVEAFLRTTYSSTTTPTSTAVEGWIDETCDELVGLIKEDLNSLNRENIVIDTNSDTTTISANAFDAVGALNYPPTSDLIMLPDFNVYELTSVEYNTIYDPSQTPVWVSLTIGDGKQCRLYQNKYIQILDPNVRIYRMPVGVRVSYNYGKSEVLLRYRKLAVKMVAAHVLESKLFSESASGDGGTVRIGDIQFGDGSTVSIGQLSILKQSIKAELDAIAGNAYYLI